MPTATPSISTMSIFFWNCNGVCNKEPKRTLIRETTQELKADIAALVETKIANQPWAPSGFNLLSFRAALTPPGSTSNLHATGGISVSKTPSSDFTGRTVHKFTGYIEAVATLFKSPSCTFTLITGNLPTATSGIRGAFIDTEFFKLQPLYGHPLLFVVDANNDIASLTTRNGLDHKNCKDHKTIEMGFDENPAIQKIQEFLSITMHIFFDNFFVMCFAILQQNFCINLRWHSWLSFLKKI